LLTPQEIKDKSFPKVRLGGLDTWEVQKFLNEVSDAYALLYKENAALKQKMKQLADKIEDYRADSNTVQQTLVAAQKVASEITAKAENERDRILSEAEAHREKLIDAAEAAARSRIEALKDEIHIHEDRLQEAKSATAQFTVGAQTLVTEFNEFLLKVNAMPFAAEQVQAKKIQDAAEVIQSTVIQEIGDDPEEDVKVWKG